MEVRSWTELDFLVKFKEMWAGTHPGNMGDDDVEAFGKKVFALLEQKPEESGGQTLHDSGGYGGAEGLPPPGEPQEPCAPPRPVPTYELTPYSPTDVQRDGAGLTSRDRFITLVHVGKRPCELWQREDVTHDSASSGINNWWVLYPEEIEIVDTFDTIKVGSFRWIPWPGHPWSARPSVRIEASYSNYIRKYDQISRSMHMVIYFEEKPAYGFVCRDFEYGMARAQMLITEMCEHGFMFWQPEQNLLNKVWYRGQPGIITELNLKEGLIQITYDGGGEGFSCMDPHQDKDFYPIDWDAPQMSVWVDPLRTERIDWHRKYAEGCCASQGETTEEGEEG